MVDKFGELHSGPPVVVPLTNPAACVRMWRVAKNSREGLRMWRGRFLGAP